MAGGGGGLEDSEEGTGAAASGGLRALGGFLDREKPGEGENRQFFLPAAARCGRGLSGVRG